MLKTCGPGRLSRVDAAARRRQKSGRNKTPACGKPQTGFCYSVRSEQSPQSVRHLDELRVLLFRILLSLFEEDLRSLREGAGEAVVTDLAHDEVAVGSLSLIHI